MPAQVAFQRGWVQRAARHLYQEGELVDALNVVPDEYGALITRAGYGVHLGPLDQLDVHSLYTAYVTPSTARLYVGAGTTLYRDGVAIATNLSGQRLTFATMRGQNEQQLWTFFANGDAALRVKDSGTTLVQWGVHPPSAAPGFILGSGPLTGTYRWVFTFIRKPIPAPAVYGTYNGGVYTDQTGSPLTISSTVDGTGHIVAATAPFAEIFYDVTTAAAGGTPVWALAYWDGSSWIAFTPTVSTDFHLTGRQRFAFDFPTTNWRQRILAGQLVYPIWVRANTAPTTTAPVAAATITVYDSAIAAESNPSPPTSEAALGAQSATFTNLPNPLTPGGNFDLQITHVGVYRTVANQSLETSPFFFVRDFLVLEASDSGNPYSDNLPDVQLGDLVAYDNDPPPPFTAIVEHQQRIFGLSGNQVYLSKFEQPDAFPPQLPFDVGTLSDPPIALWTDSGVLFVATAARVYQIVGYGTDAAGNALYIPQETALPVGIGAPASVARGSSGTYLLVSDGTLWRLRGPQGENIVDAALYQLFHGVTLNGVLPLAQAQKAVCVAEVAQNRLYVSYPTGTATTPNATLLFDERTQTWYRDSRGFRSLYYDRQSNLLYGGLTDGTVILVGNTAQDNNAPIVARVQTRDDDEGAPDSDKSLTQLGVDMDTTNTVVTATAVLDYGASAAVALGTVQTQRRQQQYLSPPVTADVKAGALGYLLIWTGLAKLYRLLPRLLRYPPRRTGFDQLPTDLGWPGAKRVEAFFLDVDLVSGALTVSLYGDSALVQTFTVSALGRQQHNLVASTFDATVLQVRMRGTGTFLLYPDTTWVWQPLPPTIRTYQSLPTDLGHSGLKILYDCCRDLEWVQQGTITITVTGDGTLLHTLTREDTQPAGTRLRLVRDRLPSTPFRLLTVGITSTADMRIWPGTLLHWKPLGVHGDLQTYALAQQALSGVQRTPIVQEAA
jgi:hypothetical protein